MRGGRTRRRPDGCGPRRPAPGWRRPGPARRPSRSGQPAVRRACQRSWRRRGSAAGPPRAGRTASAPDHRRAAGYRTTGRPRRRWPARRRFGDAHRVMQGRAFRVRIDEPGPPACRGCRVAAGGARDQGDHAGQDKDAQQDPEPDQAGAGGGDGRRGTSGRRLGGGGRRDAGPSRGGRGPARQAADRAADGAPASGRQQSSGKQGYGEGKSFR